MHLKKSLLTWEIKMNIANKRALIVLGAGVADLSNNLQQQSL